MDVVYVINFDEYKSIETHWRALCEKGHNVAYFETFGFEFIPKEVKKFISKKNIALNIYRIRAYNLLLYGYFCIAFIDFMFIVC